MAIFKFNQPIIQPDPVIKVDISAADPLPIGANRFQLIVVDDEGNESEPTFVDVIVQAPTNPTAVLDVVDSNLKPVEPRVAFGKPFILSAARSLDVDAGKIVEYRFTLIDRI
jgi:hypothetical protein